MKQELKLSAMAVAIALAVSTSFAQQDQSSQSGTGANPSSPSSPSSGATGDPSSQSSPSSQPRRLPGQSSPSRGAQDPSTGSQDQSMGSQDQSMGQDQSAQNGGQSAHPAYAGRTVSMRGTIESVDRVTRTVAIRGSDGRIALIRLNSDMANLEELQKGEQVVARYSEAVLMTIARSDAMPQVQSETTQQAPTPDQPTAATVERTSVVAVVTNVDRQNQRVTLQAPNGNEIRLGVRDPKALADLKTGDKVVATYIEAVALSIDDQDANGQATEDEDEDSEDEDSQ
jgi:Cu/Ag efflux protein CusF